MRNRSIVAIVGVVVLAVAGATLWSQGVFDNETDFPRTMCNGYVGGSQVKGLVSSREGDLTEESNRFPSPEPPSRNAHCEIRLGDDTVTIGVKYPSELATRKEVFERADRKVTFGPSYGELDNSGSVVLYLPCPHREDPRALLSLGVSADTADREYAAAESADKATRHLADLTADLARTFAQKRYKCEGAKDLPRGTLRISPALGS